MIMLRRATERHHDQRRKQEVWQTFCPRDRGGLLAGGFGILEGLSEHRLPPGAVSAAHPHQEGDHHLHIQGSPCSGGLDWVLGVWSRGRIPAHDDRPRYTDTRRRTRHGPSGHTSSGSPYALGDGVECAHEQSMSRQHSATMCCVSSRPRTGVRDRCTHIRC